MTNSLSHAELGRSFCREARVVLAERLGQVLDEEVAIGIGTPPKQHRFDLGNADTRIAIECKALTWTRIGNVPSAKITTAREAILYLQWLPDDWTRVLAMSRALRPNYPESLAEYFVRLNKHLLGTVVVVEVDLADLQILYGSL